jgi:DNA-binding ferritin-like protein (Dps family)
VIADLDRWNGSGETVETISLKAEAQTLDRAFQITREITKRVDNGEASIMQIDHVLAHPSEAQAMDVQGLVQILNSRIIILERCFTELQRYESIIGSPPTPEAPPVAPAAQSAEAPKPSPEASPHPEEMQRARALREEFRQLCAEIQKYMVEIHHVDVRADGLAYPQGKAITPEEAIELASARGLQKELELLTASITGYYAQLSAQGVDNFLNTGQMTELTGPSMADLRYRIDNMTPKIQKFREHWVKYPPRG